MDADWLRWVKALQDGVGELIIQAASLPKRVMRV
jgi:hypothetical protein